MKIKIITLAYIFLIGTHCFADNVFLNGGLSLSSEAQITSFNSRTAKLQPAVDADVFFYFNIDDILRLGFGSGFRYTFSSNLDGGWSYPGFSGIETSFDMRSATPISSRLEFGSGAEAGWYRYNLTENFFFLPSVFMYPAYRLYEDELINLWIEAPVKLYFHKQADTFMSTGLKLRAVFK